MKFIFGLTILVSVVQASPVGTRTNLQSHHGIAPDLETRQDVGIEADELEFGSCRQITFIFARGTGEVGNMGFTVGPPTCNTLKQRYGTDNVACQGVGFPYTADILPNTFPQGTSTAAIDEAKRLFTLASTKCPSTIITAAGYSQGAAVMTGAAGTLPQNVENQIAGVVLYGDTRNQQTGGTIPGLDPAKTLIICDPNDGVCYGTLDVSAAHLSYVNDIGEATDFLAGRIAAAGGP